MKTKIFTMMCMLAMCVFGCNAGTVRGNGQIITKTVSVSDFHEIEIMGNISCYNNKSIVGLIKNSGNNVGPKFYYSQKSGEHKVTVTIDSNLFPLLKIVADRGKLTFTTKDRTEINATRLEVNACSSAFDGLKNTGVFDFYTLTGIDGGGLTIEVNGSGDVFLDHMLRLNHLTLNVTGSSDIKTTDARCNFINISVSGSGDIHIAGKADEGNFNVSGSGDIKAYNCVIKKLTCAVSGSGDIQCNATQKLKATVSGSGDLKYKGNPETENHVSGSGDINHVQ